MATDEQLKNPEEYEDTPEGNAEKWSVEMEAADDFLKDFRKEAEESLKAYLESKKNVDGGQGKRPTKLGVFWRNTQLQRALMYGRTPSVEVSRKQGDANDDVARLAADIFERALNADIEREVDDGYSANMGYALDDRLPTGLGQARVRYVQDEGDEVPGQPAQVAEDGSELAPAIEATRPVVSQDVETLWVHWRDFAYSPCRVWPEVRWVGFKNEMAQKALLSRFTASLAELLDIDEKEAALKLKSVPMGARKAGMDADTSSSAGSDMDGRSKDPWSRAEVWEIWDKETKRVFWWVKGCKWVLDMKEDPLGLRGFFPCPRPMLANVTTSSMVPKSDYMMLKDLYAEIDSVSTRINRLQRSLRVVGVYDETAGDLKTLTSGGDSQMYPIKNWGRWSEKGGAAGQIDWLPLEPIVATLQQLRDYRTELMSLADQMSGIGDIIRGEGAAIQRTATDAGIQAKFASIRMGAFQDEFATFCSDIQRLKGEVMAIHFKPETFLEKANLANSFDATDDPQQILAAVQLIKSRSADYRIEVKPEAIAMQDYAAMKSERTEVIQGMAQLITAVQPMLQMMPDSVPFIGEVMKWYVAGLRGARSIEGELSKTLALAEQKRQQAQQQAAMNPAPPPPPDPKVVAVQLKMQADAQKSQQDMQLQAQKSQGDLARIQAETQSNDAKEQSQAYWGTQEMRAKHLLNPPKPTPLNGAPGGIG